MKAWTKVRVSKVLTVAYLISAAVITVATSKRPAGEPGIMDSMNSSMNYSIQSNCPGRVGAASVRVSSGAIVESIDRQYGHQMNSAFDFSMFGFPLTEIEMGQDVFSSVGAINKVCRVVNRHYQPNYSNSAEPANPGFENSGWLTTFEYRCSENNVNVCTINISELPAGELANVVDGY